MIMDEMKGHAALWDLSSPFKNTIWDLCMRELSGIVEVLVRCKPFVPQLLCCRLYHKMTHRPLLIYSDAKKPDPSLHRHTTADPPEIWLCLT